MLPKEIVGDLSSVSVSLNFAFGYWQYQQHIRHPFTKNNRRKSFKFQIYHFVVPKILYLQQKLITFDQWLSRFLFLHFSFNLATIKLKNRICTYSVTLDYIGTCWAHSTTFSCDVSSIHKLLMVYPCYPIYSMDYVIKYIGLLTDA